MTDKVAPFSPEDDVPTTEIPAPATEAPKAIGVFAAKSDGTAKGRWQAVRQNTITPKFDSWASALKAIDQAWERGELAREVKKRVAEAQNLPDNMYAYVLILLFLYWALYFILQDDMLFPGIGFAVFITWLCSTIGGRLMAKIGMPGLLGNLLAGIILKNCIPNPDCGSGSGSSGRMLTGSTAPFDPDCTVTKSVRGLPDYWSSDIITFGLTIIFLRGGLEIDLDLVKKAGAAALRLTVIPGVTEALMVATFSMIIFGMSFILGLSLGFILAAVSPAVVVGAMFELKKKGYGVKQNIPVLVVAAASFDDVVAISGFAICIAFAIPSKDTTTTSTILHAVHGPITLGLGLLLGVVVGNMNAMTKLWDTEEKRTVIVTTMGLFLSFGAKRLESEWVVDGAHPIGGSTGILGALSMAGVTSFMWERGKGYYTQGPNKDYAHHVEHNLAKLWALVAQPLLFGVVGSYLDFRVMEGLTIIRAILIIIIGVTCRTIGAFFATHGTGLTNKERLFVALSWLPKATVQAAFCGYPLTKITEKTNAGEWDSLSQQEDYEQWGEDILTTGVLAILMTAPLGLIIIQKLGPKWLEQDTSASMELGIESMVNQELDAIKGKPKTLTR